MLPMKENVIISYMDGIKPHQKILDMQTKIRQYFQEQGYSGEEIKTVSVAPEWLWKYKADMQREFEKIKTDLIRYGIMVRDDVDDDYGGDGVLTSYVMGELEKINLLYPLKDEL